jgi:hypothetical protein
MWRASPARRISRSAAVNRSEFSRAPNTKNDASTPVLGTPRAPSTAVNLGALIGVSRDDGPPPPPALRARVPTLRFYGSPPVIRAKMPTLPPHAPKPPLPARAWTKLPPPPPSDAIVTPTAPLAALIAAELARFDAPIREVVELDIEPDEPETLPAFDSAIDVSASELVDARSDRPPPPSSHAIVIPFARWRQSGTLLAAAGFGAAAIAAFALNIGVAVCVADSIAPPASPSAVAMVGITARATGASMPPPPPPPPACAIAGEPRVVARRALVAGGIETSIADGRLAFGVVTSPREGRAIEVDIHSLATIGSARLASAQPLRRTVPILPTDDAVDVAADTNDRARTAIDPLRGALGLSPARIWKLQGMPVDGVRAAPLTSMKGYAIALRRANAIWLGATGGDDAQTPYAPLVRLSEPGRRIGAPSVAVSADAVVVAWAERTNDTPWRIKWVRLRPGLAPESARDLVIPAGGLGEQAMSPSVAGLDDGRVLLAWTEGPASNHQVRAQLIGADDATSGAAFALSADGVFSGQAQVALGADGRGVVAFFASRGGDYDAVAVPMACKR